MSEGQAVKREVITLPEAKEILERLDPDQMDQIQKRTLDYLSKFVKLGIEEARQAKRRLVEEVGLTEEEAAEVVNIMPKSIEELRVFTAGWRKLLPTESLERILAILGEEAGQ
jgi:DNA-directed RNA polymerase subunit F